MMPARRKLGVLTSHPIQYQAPIFRELARHVDLQLFFAHQQSGEGQADAGFKVPFNWDVDLLSGYKHEFLQNTAHHPNTGRFLGCDTPGLRARIRDEKFNAFLVMGWNLKAYWQAVVACREQGVPVLVRGDSQLGTARSPLKKLAKEILYPAMLRQFDACLYVGQKNRAYLEHYGVSPDRLFFSPHCVDNARFATTTRLCDSDKLRRDLGLHPEDLVILFAGKLIEMKRPGDLLGAIHRLRDRVPGARALFVGDGPLRGALEARAKSLNIPAHFLGFWNQSQLPNSYAIADVLVLPSNAEETWGLVVNEALACGIRAVVSDSVGCGPDLITSGETGEIFTTGNEADLSDALQRVLQTPCRPETLAARVNKYSPESAARGILEALDHACRGSQHV